MSFFRYLCRSRRLRCWGSGTWRAPLSLEPLARFVTGGAGARPDHPISGDRLAPSISPHARTSTPVEVQTAVTLITAPVRALVASISAQGGRSRGGFVPSHSRVIGSDAMHA